MAKNTLDDAIAGLKDLAKEVKRYCERLISNAKFDRTAVGTIVKVLDDHSGYVVAAFGKECNQQDSVPERTPWST